VRDDVAGVVSDLTGVDVPASSAAKLERLRDLDAFLSERVLGQPEAVAAAAQLIRMAKRELDLDPGRPDGVMLFMGPAGAGKTSLACAIAEFLHGKGDDALVRLDMADYAEPHSLGRLIGSPPGYVGYEEEGQLTGRIRTQPDAVLLLDDIDRAHPTIRSLFTQVFEEGRLTDSRGRCVHFDHTTIILTTTSDVGEDTRHAGFRHGDPSSDLESRARATLSSVLTMEFVSRIDRVIVLRPLSMAVITEIAAKMLCQVAGRLLGEGKTLIVGDGVAEAVARQDYNARFGARHLARSVEAMVLGPISTLSYSAGWNKASAVTLFLDGTSVKVDLAVR
jgi:ATP-dependent Clp protease ATP-binding subunit ClpA